MGYIARSYDEFHSHVFQVLKERAPQGFVDGDSIESPHIGHVPDYDVTAVVTGKLGCAREEAMEAFLSLQVLGKIVTEKNESSGYWGWRLVDDPRKYQCQCKDAKSARADLENKPR